MMHPNPEYPGQEDANMNSESLPTPVPATIVGVAATGLVGAPLPVLELSGPRTGITYLSGAAIKAA